MGKESRSLLPFVLKALSDNWAARQIANTIANSPLVKTAFFGNDANWGRIAMAAGRAGVEFEQEKLALWISPGEDYSVKQLQLLENGMPLAYSEAAATAIIKESSSCIILDCGVRGWCGDDLDL